MAKPSGILGGHNGHLVTQHQSQVLTPCSRAARNLGLEFTSEHGQDSEPTPNHTLMTKTLVLNSALNMDKTPQPAPQQILLKQKESEIMHLNVRSIIKDDKNLSLNPYLAKRIGSSI